MVEVVLQGAKFGVEKVNGGQIYAIELPVLEMQRILKNKLSPLRVIKVHVVINYTVTNKLI